MVNIGMPGARQPDRRLSSLPAVAQSRAEGAPAPCRPEARRHPRAVLVRLSLCKPGYPQSFRVLRQVASTPIGAENVFEVRNT